MKNYKLRCLICKLDTMSFWQFTKKHVTRKNYIYRLQGAFEIVDKSLKETYEEWSMRNTTSIASRYVDIDASQDLLLLKYFWVFKEAYNIRRKQLYLETAGAGLST